MDVQVVYVPLEMLRYGFHSSVILIVRHRMKGEDKSWKSTRTVLVANQVVSYVWHFKLQLDQVFLPTLRFRLVEVWVEAWVGFGADFRSFVPL